MNIFAPISVMGHTFDRPLISRVRQPFNDARSYKVWRVLGDCLGDKQKAIIQQLAPSPSEADQMYHFLNNPGLAKQNSSR